MDTALPKPAGRLILDSDGTRRVVSIETLPFTLGRSAECHLSLAHPHVSREHAVITRDVYGYILADTASRHGTRVNGAPITSARLRSGDQITLGSGASFLFEESEDDSNSTRTLIAHLSSKRVQSVEDQSDTSSSELETLSLFLKAVQSLNIYGVVNNVLRAMLEYTIRLTGAERGFVFLGDDPGTFTLECGQDKAGTPLTDHGSISRSIIRDAITSQHDFILSDTTVEAARNRESVILHAIRSVVAIPLRGQSADRLLGLLYLDSRTLTHNFTNTSRDILRTIAHQAATLLENLRMIEAEREAVFLRKELEIAASIQRQIIPQTLPEFPGVTLAARSIPCTGVGGDFYDVIPAPDGFVAIVGDVCGKGIPAALLASMVQGMFHAQASTGTPLVDTIQAVNSFVCSRAPGEKYVTLAALRYTCTPTGGVQIELINGGHVSPLIIRANGSIEAIVDGDMPVGLLSFATFHTISFALDVGDRILLLSDGISEAEDSEGTQFGQHELARHITQPELIPTLFTAVDRFCEGAHAQDDQTALFIHRTS